MPASSRQRLFDPQASSVFLLYLALSILIFGRAIIAHPTASYIGRGPDPQLYIWFIAWWAHSIANWNNPLLTGAIWAPGGVNLAWTANMPLAAIAVYPITRLFGPIAAYNLLCLTAPALAGCSAFVLCRWCAGEGRAALFAGMLFAFSPYVLSRMLGNMDLILIWPVPLAAYVVMRALAGEIGARRLAIALAALIAAQFLLFAEIAASATLFAAIALLLALPSMTPQERVRLRAAAAPIATAYALAALVLSPYLYFMFALPAPRGRIFSAWHFAIDLVNFIVPTSVNQLGRISCFAPLAHRFRAELSESGAYLGLPLIAIVVWFARERWHAPRGRFLIHLLIVICLLAMGPRLELAGHIGMALPGSAVARIPLLDKALPARFMLYAYLVLALIVAKWLADSRARRARRWALAFAVVPFMLPNLSASYWATSAAMPEFFTTGLYRHYLAPGATVAVLPFGLLGEGMLWQAGTDFYFRMAEGYVSFAPPVPDEQRRWPIIEGLYHLRGVPDASEQFMAYLANHNVAAVIVGRRRQYRVGWIDGGPTATTWLRAGTLAPEHDATIAMLEKTGAAALEVGGVKLYRLTPASLASYRQCTALMMEQRAARERFDALLAAAQRYLDSGDDPRRLSPKLAARLGLFPRGWFGGSFLDESESNPIFASAVTLRVTAADEIEIGLEAEFAALQLLAGSYARDAIRIDLRRPPRSGADEAPHDRSMLLAVFDRHGLARASTTAAPN